MPTLPLQENAAGAADEELVERIVAGDQSAFALLMRRFNRPLYRAARSIVKDDVEAEDVLQEAYLLAHRRLHAFRGEARLLTWLTRIVVNEAMARQRKAARRARIIPIDGSVDDVSAEPGTAMEIDYPDNPEASVMRAEARQLLERKIDQLPEAFRTVFVLRVVEDMSVEEVGAALGIPEATVRSRHFRARSMLRESLSREFDHVLEDAFNFDGARCDRIVAGTLERLAGAPVP
ncbi:RNA polymerase sigma factor [Noviherbaspirillum galbum]|uniref:RNA polymerase sigma factor n=1 Tax=Noviherbaspirillum galbum TaxID=2709383 RepID=A0A6B3SJF2_9BURK|nr:RNA polymerase sigma factor [Noviherbaspirillum galbum]NEX59485.1 RNA polymerase sigma factor [Noviherbaspirillum galbum]